MNDKIEWVLVPREPTDDMLTAFHAADKTRAPGRTLWAAMLAASPKPEAAGALAGEGNALRAIAEGNLGDGPGQANYLRIREFARAALSAAPAPAQQPAVVGDGRQLQHLLDCLSSEHGGDHHDDGCDICRAIAALTPAATPTAQKEGNGNG